MERLLAWKSWVGYTNARLGKINSLESDRYSIIPDMVRERFNNKIGKVITHGDVNIWPHEAATAKSLAKKGETVEFIRKSEKTHVTSADIFINGTKWEMKAPRSGKLSAVEDNLKKASKQSDRVVFDSRRMKRIPDKAIMRELVAKSHINKSINRVKFIDRHGKVIDIK